MASRSLEETFKEPPDEYGPVPFYWWAGERLDRERMAWQLDQLRGQGVRRTVVSYPHLPDGSCDPGDPPLFSSEWWDFFRWFLGACRERGMTVGFQDYNLMAPVLTAIGLETPGMEGGQMSCVSGIASCSQKVRLAAEPNCPVIGAWAYPITGGRTDPAAPLALSDAVSDGVLIWTAPEGEWLVALVFVRPAPFDPMHPVAGAQVVERFYQRFERECGSEVGTTLDLFFQDELDFGGRMPFWSGELLDCFLYRAGYDLAPMLPALWHDLGPVTEKVRLDYADVVASCLGERFFEPVFRWHEERGILFGHDNCGRGRIAEGRSCYGDYFRAMRWYSAPGCDDPKLDGPRAFKGLKVNSSIAHLYGRPRVWIEAFHSSGWGSRPAEVVAALHEDFACGANLVNLHGLYYTTFGGWWEWAAPDFHFRQPYWRHARPLNDCLTRISWILSQGIHRCEAAIVYPIEALDAAPARPEPPALVAHNGNEAITAGEGAGSDPEETAFGLGKLLFDQARDFDFIDAASLAAADVREGELHAGTARYRLLLLPAMSAVRLGTLTKARDFVRNGGLVAAVGCLPRASERAGRDDPKIQCLLEEIFGSADDSGDRRLAHAGGGRAAFFRTANQALLDWLRESVEPVASAAGPLHVLRRELEDGEVLFLTNPSSNPVRIHLASAGHAAISEWNAWTGEVGPCEEIRDGSTVLAPHGARILMVERNSTATACGREAGELRLLAALDGPWNTEVHPVLDNRFGDFHLPAAPEVLGPQARRFRYADETTEEKAWIEPAFDDAAWPETTFSFGAQMECLGPLEAGRDPAELADSPDWRPYVFSRRLGIERDPFLTDWLSGPHGLKGRVPDEFLDFHSDRPGRVWYVRGQVIVPAGGEHTLVTGGRCAYRIWINGESVAHQPDSLEPGRHPRWNIPHYECEAVSSKVALHEGGNDLLVELVQPEGQRTRAFFAFDPPSDDPAGPVLRWFTDPMVPRACRPAAPGRRAVRFRFPTPPGVREVQFVACGVARAWIGGQEISLICTKESADGCRSYRGRVGNCGRDPQVMALRVVAPSDCHGGDALPEPVSFECGAGSLPAGDWCDHGLATYSGIVEYRRAFQLTEFEARQNIVLDLGEIRASAEVCLNGRLAATLLAPPWRCDLTSFLRPGRNELSVLVANTLANHYSVGIPTPYAFAAQTRSGLLGPVCLFIRESCPS